MRVGSSSSRAGKVCVQPPAGLRGAGQHVGDRVPRLLTRIPKLDHRGDLVEPRHHDRRAGLENDDGLCIDGGDALDQFVLAARQVEVGTVFALGVPFSVESDEQQGDVGGLRERDRALQLGVADARARRRGAAR